MVRLDYDKKSKWIVSTYMSIYYSAYEPLEYSPGLSGQCSWCQLLPVIDTVHYHILQYIETFHRETLQEFLWTMRTEEGSFRMHEGGEVDIRGVYCAVSVARLTNICTEGLFAGTPHWIMR